MSLHTFEWDPNLTVRELKLMAEYYTDNNGRIEGDSDKRRMYNNGGTFKVDANPVLTYALTYMAAVTASCLNDVMIAINGDDDELAAALVRLEHKLQAAQEVAYSRGAIQLRANTDIAELATRIKGH